MVIYYYHLYYPDFILKVWQAAKPVLVTCGPSRPYFRCLTKASRDGHFLLPSQYGIPAKPVLVTCGPSKTLFSRFGKGVWGLSFPITISIWNYGETRFGDLRAVQTLFSRLGKGVWDGHFLLPSQYGKTAKPILVSCGPSRPYFRGLARASGDGHFLLPFQRIE